MRKTHLIVLFAFIINGCSTTTLIKVDGIKQVDIKQDSYEAPQFYVKDFKPQKINRGIASQRENSFSSFTPKKIYFLTMWQQQKVFEKLLNISKPEMSCPHFHNDLLEHGDSLDVSGSSVSLKTQVSSMKNDPQVVLYYPVMSLPYKGVDVYSFLKQNHAWEEANTHITNAVYEHYNHHVQEVEKLCTTGSSDGLYVYQNMATYYSSDEKFQESEMVLPAILKITPISNMLVLNTFVDEPFSPMFNDYQEAMLEKLNVVWFKNYLYEVTSMRKNKFTSFALKE